MRGWFGVGILALVLSLGGCLQRDEISETLLASPSKAQRSLSPVPFAPGENRQAIEARLISAGYERHRDLTGGFEGAEVWLRGIQGMPCNKTLEVFLAFDTTGRLTRAEGVHLEAGCL